VIRNEVFDSAFPMRDRYDFVEDDDHANAAMRSRGLVEAAERNVRLRGRFTAHPAQTNILFTDIAPTIASEFFDHLDASDIQVKRKAASIVARKAPCAEFAGSRTST
jgi:hypothetical protein